MRELDRRASEEFGIPSRDLMEKAGHGVADIALQYFNPSKVLILCGKGNNGGDGFVAARYLFEAGRKVVIVMAGEPSAQKGDALLNYQTACGMGIPMLVAREQKDIPALVSLLRGVDLVVDALFGIGLERAVEGLPAGLIEAVNASGKAVLAVDIPSGLNGDTGEIMGVAIKASITAVLGAPKLGLYKSFGPELAGKINLVDIGLPRELLL